MFWKAKKRITKKDYRKGIERLRQLLGKYISYLDDEREPEAYQTLIGIIDLIYELSMSEDLI